MKTLTSARAVAKALHFFYVKGKHRWIQHSYHDDQHNSFCLLGACFELGLRSGMKPLPEFQKAIIGDDFRTLVSWNDAQGRTRRQVISALRRVAAS